MDARLLSPSFRSRHKSSQCVCANTRVGCQSRAELAQNTHCRTAYQLQQSTSCHRACQRYIACQLSHNSLMTYRSPTATAYQLPQSLPAAAELASRRACQPPQSFASRHRACQLPQSLPAATGLTNGTQLTNCHTTRFFFLPSLNSFLPFADHTNLMIIRRGNPPIRDRKSLALSVSGKTTSQAEL
jgi:hypothetical protein